MTQNIYSIDPTTGESSTLFTISTPDNYTSFSDISPDGTKVAYIDQNGDHDELHIATLDGVEDNVIATLSYATSSWGGVAWGARYIALVEYSPTCIIRFFDVNGNPPTDALPFIDYNWGFIDFAFKYGTGFDDYMGWSPGGRYLYCSLFKPLNSSTNEGSNGVVRLDIQDLTKTPTEIWYPALDHVGGYTVTATNLRVSPDGTKITFTVQKIPYPGGGTFTYDQWIVDENGANAHLLQADFAWANWSPDSLSMVGYNVVGGVGGSPLWAINRDGTNYHEIAASPPNSNEVSGWTPASLPAPADSVGAAAQPTAVSNYLYLYPNDGSGGKMIRPNGTGIISMPAGVDNLLNNNYWGNAAVSTDGKYMLTSAPYPTASYQSKILKTWLQDGTHQRIIYDSGRSTKTFNDGGISWSGNKIYGSYYDSVASKYGYIWMDPEGSNQVDVLLTDKRIAGSDGGRAISPNGTELICYDSLANTLIVIDAATGTTNRTLGSLDSFSMDPCWSPDGTKIALFQGGILKIINSTTGAVLNTVSAASIFVVLWDPAGVNLALLDSTDVVSVVQQNGTVVTTIPSKTALWLWV